MFQTKTKKVAQIKKVLENGLNVMKKERMYRVPFSLETTDRADPFGDWVDINKKKYFFKEQNTAKEQKFIDAEKNYEANFLLAGYIDDEYKTAVAQVERFKRFGYPGKDAYSGTEPVNESSEIKNNKNNLKKSNKKEGEKNTYHTNIWIKENLNETAADMLAQDCSAKELEEEINNGLEEVRKIQIQKYQSNFANNQAYEVSKQFLEKRDAPADEPIFEALRKQINFK